MQKVIILLGPPGSGKGTQAKRLTQTLNIPHISTGDLFRENIGHNTELGKKAQEFMNHGKLVPDELVMDMLLDRLKKTDCQEGYLLDGFPRTIPQAQAFEKSLPEGVEPIVYNLDISHDLIKQRLTGRLNCKKCGFIHHRLFSPPKQSGVCDQCGGDLWQRPDDHENVINERLAVYAQQTEPLIDYYQKKGLLVIVDAKQTPEEIFEEVNTHFTANK